MKKVVKKKGGDWAIEVSVHNRGKAVEGAIVTDTVPHNFTLSSSFETLKPIVRKMELGTQLIWRIGGIRRGEEKILHYRIAPKIHSGPVRLPAAHLRAKKGEKTIIASTGNAVLAIEKGPPKLSVER
jgi:hypothetical protein